MSIIPISQWFGGVEKRPLIIAGPCSAESREQVLDTARSIASLGKVQVLRAGVWKPRSRPGTFQGVGEQALVWLAEAKKETGLLLAVEVATPEHLEIALKHGVDMFWVGARTTSNPFSVDELARAMAGVDKPVLIKNPIHPDLEMWIGTIERFSRVGITKLGAIHRGFSPFQKSNYRNLPKWEVPIDLKTYIPELPIICDPSHIAGKWELIFNIAQKALDLSMDGLMIESHICPEKALSDARQQVTPEKLGEILTALSYRKMLPTSSESIDALESMREKIDSLDSQLLELLAQRMDIVRQIGEYKLKNNVAIMQLRRWEEMIKMRVEVGNSLGLSPEYVKDLLRLVHKESVRKQADIISPKDKANE
ncbi:MAG: bifunctional 3-deoxy-7-phosphoheptulonate synthase/chorismate mutase type II [Tenuifilaceae bacterium]|jgi:chorismate mutase|nr:bifunctional 3-deoxy-7-phosphoheptulonate synthase/chorismate mutase type II [Tenuifilaceae bacterium]